MPFPWTKFITLKSQKKITRGKHKCGFFGAVRKIAVSQRDFPDFY